MNTAEKDALHAAITGLRATPKVLAKMEGSPKGFYLLGFDAARHAAAELVRSLVAPQEVRMLTEEDMQALSRFNETCEDGQGYDLSKDRMKRLAELGVVQWCGASRYSMTAFGQYVLDLLPEGWPRLPLKTHADHDDYANAAIKEQAVKPATDKEMPK